MDRAGRGEVRFGGNWVVKYFDPDFDSDFNSDFDGARSRLKGGEVGLLSLSLSYPDFMSFCRAAGPSSRGEERWYGVGKWLVLAQSEWQIRNPNPNPNPNRPGCHCLKTRKYKRRTWSAAARRLRGFNGGWELKGEFASRGLVAVGFDYDYDYAYDYEGEGG